MNDLPYAPPPWTEPYQWRVTVHDTHGRLITDYGLMGLSDAQQLAFDVDGDMEPCFSVPHEHGTLKYLL